MGKLDGSFVGRLRNLDTVRDMLAFNNVAIQLSGGIRKMRDIDEAFAVGVDRVLVNASTILRHPHIITEAIEKYGAGRILAAIDGRNGMITSEGYETPLSHTVQSMLKEAKAPPIYCQRQHPERLKLFAAEAEFMP